jgi:hypothetical protein
MDKDLAKIKQFHRPEMMVTLIPFLFKCLDSLPYLLLPITRMKYCLGVWCPFKNKLVFKKKKRRRRRKKEK